MPDGLRARAQCWHPGQSIGQGHGDQWHPGYGGYQGSFIDWVNEQCDWLLEIVKRTDKTKGFQVLPRRWIVERIFGWLGRYRRLSKDYEELTDTSEAMILAAMTHIMIRRLVPASPALDTS